MLSSSDWKLRQEYLLSLLLAIALEVLVNSIRLGKNKVILVEKGEVKLFIDAMIVFVEKTKESIKSS